MPRIGQAGGAVVSPTARLIYRLYVALPPGGFVGGPADVATERDEIRKRNDSMQPWFHGAIGAQRRSTRQKERSL